MVGNGDGMKRKDLSNQDGYARGVKCSINRLFLGVERELQGVRYLRR